ncbi:Hsp20/alpha crystallin family protein [Haloferax mediterranei ATCC 33500]|uniref:Hsp20 type chaperone n=1 Tax=Haloferax mediterranei (strain ATCC 33500 / DSM 1411 / JCM 8866 / NBRC 14739 / NCIMB 2177 / R-4) TaxID=523841 RepID=I3R6Z0_HALMT|nr:Hsp20/alpha crystallin family protein [Haloferax mediterranei]AFK20000.1 hsp20 type chaperone [Haloferax mediterranei ATCC 33500]AHZ23379.1 molecular chaperone Hsp20 [Haloferax mediterranei ATCC 33500]ELZ99547.1 hsp20 type chaperone [Haloferax mediterranei ATCC 33500]MDX5987247.1 Hsp20/alpha crystallin family protein [Haloferax mediterranei ATCC 33500]QCQ73769.1 Hsp20/alpha crystallin family protein [Haloferax mediterranei ATCC 33500]
MSTLRDALSELPDAVFADLLESETSYLLVLDLPGVTAGTADLRVEKGRLVVEARRDKSLPPEFDYVREERPLFLDAELPLPPDAVADDAEATMERGTLEIRLPKRKAATERTIPITAGDDEGTSSAHRKTSGDVDEGTTSARQKKSGDDA